MCNTVGRSVWSIEKINFALILPGLGLATGLENGLSLLVPSDGEGGNKYFPQYIDNSGIDRSSRRPFRLASTASS